MRTVCPHCTFYTFASSSFSLLHIVLFPSFISAHIEHCRSHLRSDVPCGTGPQALKSKLCLWITIHQNKFPVHPPQETLITDENLFYLQFSHFWPCFRSIGVPGLYLVCRFLAKRMRSHVVLQSKSTFIDRGGH